MDWEIFDLDGDEIVIRRSQTAKPWGEVPSSKRLPRSAGSVNRARRCEQVQELIRFCEDHDASAPSSRRNTVKQDASCGENSRKIRAMASVPNLRGATRDQKHSKPKLRLRAVLSRERSPEGGRFQMLQSPLFKDSTTSLHMTTSPKGPLSSPIAGRSSSVGGKGVDCECYYPGVAVLPSVRNSIEESHDEKDKTQGDCAAQTDQEMDAKSPVTAPRFVNPWTPRGRAEDASSHGAGSAKRSTMSSHRQSASDEWTTRASNSFEDDTPSTPATSAFSSVASPTQSLRDKPKSFGRDSNQLDPRFLPQRGSSKLVQEVTGSTRRTRLSPQASREYLISRVQDVDTSLSSTGDVQSKRNGGHWPLGGLAFLDGESQIATESLAALPSVSGPKGDFTEHSMRDRLMSAPSVPVMHESSSVQYCSKDVSEAISPLTARSRSIGDLLPPLPDLDYESKPLPRLPAFARPGQKIHCHKRNMATVGANSTVPSTQTSTALRNADPPRRRLHSRVPPPIRIPKQPPNTSCASIPLSPRTVRPSSPPNIPLPADPPVPPSRASSLYRTIAHQASNASSESLVDPELAINCSTQDTRRTIRSRPTLRRNFSEYTLSNHEEVVPGTSHSAPLSLASSARASRIDQCDESTGHDPASGIPAGDCNDAQNAAVPASPSCMASISKHDISTSRHGHGPISHSRQSSHSRSHAPLSPDQHQLESRVAFLERQNKMLQAALIAALDVGVGAAVGAVAGVGVRAGVGVGAAVGHDTDSARTSGSTSMRVALSGDASACVSRSGSAAGSGSGSRSGPGSRSASFVGEAGQW